MQGFNYSQLYSALQVWPYKSSSAYLASLNRIIWLGELRLVRDLDLPIFDTNDQVTLAPGSAQLNKPSQAQPLVFSGALAIGATSGTLASNWAGVSGVYMVNFSSNDFEAVTLTAGSPNATWINGLTAAATVNAVIPSLFVTERTLWSVYKGNTRIMVKRGMAFIQNYLGATPGRVLYYADLDPNVWLIAPASTADTTAVKRQYIRRPPSIVAVNNTFLGDNLGDCLFAACLMESEQWLKADDRYADMRTKYYQELLPAARAEMMGKPLQPSIHTPQAAPAQPQAQG